MRKVQWERGFSTIEMVIALFGFVLASLVGLHLVALSTGAAAESSSIAANLARARMEELLSLPPSQIIRQNDTEVVKQVPPGQGRPYTVHTTVDTSDPARLDITVTATWQIAYGSACAPERSEGGCAGSLVTYTRTMQTRIAWPSTP